MFLGHQRTTTSESVGGAVTGAHGSRRMSGTASKVGSETMNSPNANQSEVRMPIAAEIGPQIARPSG